MAGTKEKGTYDYGIILIPSHPFSFKPLHFPTVRAIIAPPKMRLLKLDNKFSEYNQVFIPNNRRGKLLRAISPFTYWKDGRQ